jgi:hypothetical protein
MTKTTVFTVLFLLGAAAGHAERQTISVHSGNFHCSIEENTNYLGSDGRTIQKVYWVFADYVTNYHDTFRAFILGNYDDKPGALAACKLVDEVISESLAAGGILEVEAKTYTYKARIQGSEGSEWTTRPACWYDIITRVVKTLEFPKNLVLKHETISSERFSDECK